MSKKTRQSLEQNFVDLDKISERIGNTLHRNNNMLQNELSDMEKYKKHPSTRDTHTSHTSHKSSSHASAKTKDVLSSDVGNNISFY